MKYVYYDPATMQVMAEFDTPILARQEGWEGRGYVRAVCGNYPVTRDHRILEVETIDGEVHVSAVAPQVNPEQPVPSASELARSAARESGRDKLAALGLTDEELQAMGLGR